MYIFLEIAWVWVGNSTRLHSQHDLLYSTVAMEKQENKMQALVKIHIRRIEELLGIIYNESNEMLVKFRAHFLRKNIVL